MIHELITTGLALGLGGLAAVTTLKCRAVAKQLHIVRRMCEQLDSECYDLYRRCNELEEKSATFAKSRSKRKPKDSCGFDSTVTMSALP
jgi:hypothetical protein